jgi:DNA-binding NarL/FixJ family response regulator
MSSDLLAGVLAKDAYFACEVVQSAQLLQSLEAAKADLVVITVDANSNPGQSFALANSVRLACPSVNIVCLLNQITSAFVIKAFRSGACGVCARKRSLSEFIDCLKRVAQGCIWAGPWETAALLQAFMLIPAPDIALGCNAQELTERELQVVQCASKGMTNKAIAGELRLSEHTVKNYLFKAFEKLGVSSRVELLFYLTTRQKVNELATDDDSDAVYNTEAAG